MSKSLNNTENLKHSLNVTQIERAFKRMKFDNNKCDNKCHDKSNIREEKYNGESNHDNCFNCQNESAVIVSNHSRKRLTPLKDKCQSHSSVKESSKLKSTKLCRNCDKYKYGLKCLTSLNEFKDIKCALNASKFETKSLKCSETYNHWRKKERNGDSHINKLDKIRHLPEDLTLQCDDSDESVDELAAYFDDSLYIPRKMSFMAEMMYT